MVGVAPQNVVYWSYNADSLQKVDNIFFQNMLIFFLSLVIQLLNFMGID